MNGRTELKRAVYEANMALHAAGLVTLTWGNVSGRLPGESVFAIKPSGVPYERLAPEHMTLVDFDGRVVEGTLRPSSDTPTHLRLYRAFRALGGIAHTHSIYATAFAQAGREIPCFGTTHADHFHGPVPLVRALTPAEVADDYEGHTGRAIVERMDGLDPLHVPGALCRHHGPFAWGLSAMESVHNAIALETVARMAALSLALEPGLQALPAHIGDKHFFRKHGPDATYGQKRQ